MAKGRRGVAAPAVVGERGGVRGERSTDENDVADVEEDREKDEDCEELDECESLEPQEASRPTRRERDSIVGDACRDPAGDVEVDEERAFGEDSSRR